MKKRILALFVIAAFVVLPSFAGSIKMASLKTTTQPTWSVGVALGTTSGVSAKYRMNKDWTLAGTVGFAAIHGDLSMEYYGMYKATEFEINDLDFDVNAGLGTAIDLNFTDSTSLAISALATGEISYSFNDDLPIDLLLRVSPGVKFDFAGDSVDLSFNCPASIIGLYRLVK